MATANLALRFLLELAGIAALAAWGWTRSGELPTRLGLAVAAPVALVVVWAVVIAPKAANPVPQDARVLLGSALLLLASAALAAAVEPGPGVALAVIVVLNTVLLFVLGRPEV